MTLHNEPAFPMLDPNSNYSQYGLTKREYFAAMAMQGFLSSWGKHDVDSFKGICTDAVFIADELIEQLNNQ